MTDFADGAAAPTAPASAPANEGPATPPNPVEIDNRAPAPKEAVAEKPAPTARDAVKAAIDKVKARESGEDGAAPAPVQTGQQRDPSGKFASREGAAPQPVKPAPQQPAQPAQRLVLDAPSRFSEDAKAAWATAPDPVKSETHRMLNELQQGVEKHREAATNYEQVRDFDQMARESGTTLRDALTQYTTIERTLRSDPVGGLKQICANMGFSLHDIAAHVLGQQPDQQRSQSDAVIRGLIGKIQQLEQRVGGVAGTIEQQQSQALLNHVDTFAADKPRFEELAEEIVFFIEKKGVDLDEAYRMAELLKPAPIALNAGPQTAAASAGPQTAKNRNGSRSITGAPGPGGQAADQKAPASSIREAIDRAIARVGA